MRAQRNLERRREEWEGGVKRRLGSQVVPRDSASALHPGCTTLGPGDQTRKESPRIREGTPPGSVTQPVRNGD